MPALDLDLPVAQLTRALVDIPSPSGQEQAIADAVEEALRAYPHLTVSRNGDAVVASTNAGRGTRVIIAGHLDTVPIKDNVPGRVSPDGQSIWGRGTVDMKAGVAVMLSAAALNTAPAVDVTWVFYDHEEVEAHKNGLGRLVREQPELISGDFAILCEPTSGRLEGGCQGTLRAEITLDGVAAHSARSWKGLNAIHLTAPLLGALATYKARRVTVDGLKYREGLNAVGIRGGIAGNVIPDQCVVTINYRFAPSLSIDEAKKRVCLFVDAAYADTGLSVGIDWTDESPGARPGLDSPLVQSFAAAVAQTGVGKPVAKLGWTDVARFSEMGIPAVNFGPGNPEDAHTDHETVQISEITNCLAALNAWLQKG